MGARREVLSAVAERYWPAGRVEKGYILDALCWTTGWHRKHAVRALRQRVVTAETRVPRERKRRYGTTIKDALTALWEASDRVCGKRLVAMIPILLPALEQHGRLQLSEGEHGQLLAVGRDNRSNARRREGCGSGRPSPTGGLLLRDPS